MEGHVLRELFEVRLSHSFVRPAIGDVAASLYRPANMIRCGLGYSPVHVPLLRQLLRKPR